MRAFALLTAVAKELRLNWADSFRAEVVVAEDPAHAMDLMKAGSKHGSKVVLFYVSDRDDDTQMIEGTRVEAQIRMAVVKSPGLKMRSGKQIPPVLDICDELRKHLGGVCFDDVLDGYLQYEGATFLPTEKGKVLHGYAQVYTAKYAYDI